MLNRNSSAGTAAQKWFKCSLLQRPAIILAMLLLLCAVFYVKGQNKLLPDSGTITSGMLMANSLSNFKSSNSSFFIRETYPYKDTLRCLFLEITDTLNTFTKWSKGYVIREKGFFKFGNTSVMKEYLPITDGIIDNILLYDDKKIVKNISIKIVLLK